MQQSPNLPPNFNYYGQNPNFPNENNKPSGNYGLWVSVANVALYFFAVMLVLFTMRKNDAAVFTFMLGLLFSFVNLVGMIVFIVTKKTGGWIACLIFMLLFPLLGFFTCTLAGGVQI